ncbi:hypothetical protein NECAME_07885 [Necator americanus]|uniref:ATP-dependent DNA helicase n=1 Tax=Necator americanus TaxID=51031 RepID=W2TKD9_NECAM|nr:hypothetical protein NECAME_07885 [Necator americanus]ETN82550.1 hypothetical protein NECAME_07885 [Necator americanus]
MTPKYALEAVDGLLRDIMQNDRPLDGKLCIIGGDFQQVLLIVKAGSETTSENNRAGDPDLYERTISAPTNSNVRQLNNEALERLCISGPQDVLVYKSVVEALHREGRSDELYPMEYLNTLEPAWMPYLYIILIYD